MYSLYFMYCEPPGRQGGHQGVHARSTHHGAQVGTAGVV
jgi:hypothetical protein